jgi:protein KTI12
MIKFLVNGCVAIYEEKKLRSTFMSTVERHLSRDEWVIADSMAYIKGYRYQMYCAARAIPTPHCLVYCDTPVDLCRQWNLKRSANESFDTKVFEELVMRFEEPKIHQRWDTPMIIVQAEDEEVPITKVLDALHSKKNVVPTQATLPNTAANTELLQELDETIQNIILQILDAQKQGGDSDAIHIDKFDIPISLCGKQYTLPELRRLRRQFMQMNKMHRVKERIGESFITYLNSQQ